MNRNVYHYSEDLKPSAQKLRRDMTKEEKHLWYDYLKMFPVQFRRQKQFGIYIVDFFCAHAKLVIEIDGSYHHEARQAQWDKARTDYLNSLGLEVLRFHNADVREHFEGVCTQILIKVNERMKEMGNMSMEV